MRNRLSVIIVTSDRPQAVRHALQSLMAQQLDDLQVIVVNDGSADLRDLIASYRPVVDVELVTSRPGNGPSLARNAGIAAADGDLIAFLDDDDVLLPGHFDAILPVFRSGTVDAAYTTTMVAEMRVELESQADFSAWRGFDYEFNPDFLRIVNCIPATGVVLRAPGAGGPRFDPDVRTLEDWDMWHRLAASGYRFRHVDVASAICHRLPRYAGLPDPAREAARVLRLCHESYLDLCDRWPVAPQSRASLGRAFVLRTYRFAFSQLKRGRLLGAFWYENMVRTLYEYYNENIRASEVPDRLTAALAGQSWLPRISPAMLVTQPGS